MRTSISQNYKHISGAERHTIATLRHLKHSIHTIARLLGRSPSTISRELKRNGGARVYDEDKADVRARKRWEATHHKSHLTHEQRELVRHFISLYYTSAQVSYMISLTHPEHSISYESIYMYIYEVERTLITYLRRGHKQRHQRKKITKSRNFGISNRGFITKEEISQEKLVIGKQT